MAARQTIDTLALLSEKTKGNLTAGGRQLPAKLPVRIADGIRGSDQCAGPPAAWRPDTNPATTMKATLTVLGSGTSMGVPTIGCDCAVCRSTDPHDRRTRPSIMIEYRRTTVLIDTTPDFREQAIRESIRRLDAVLYTHAHADHILGIDDLRPLSYRHKAGKMPLYARPEVAAFMQQNVPLHFRRGLQIWRLAAGRT